MFYNVLISKQKICHERKDAAVVGHMEYRTELVLYEAVQYTAGGHRRWIVTQWNIKLLTKSVLRATRRESDVQHYLFYYLKRDPVGQCGCEVC